VTNFCGHNFPDSLLDDRCTRCSRRWAEVLVGEGKACVGELNTLEREQRAKVLAQIWDETVAAASS
jgi:hypothetical protein